MKRHRFVASGEPFLLLMRSKCERKSGSPSSSLLHFFGLPVFKCGSELFFFFFLIRSRRLRRPLFEHHYYTVAVNPFPSYFPFIFLCSVGGSIFIQLNFRIKPPFPFRYFQ